MEEPVKLKSLTITKPMNAIAIPLAPGLVTPGEILEEEFLGPLNISQNQLAKRMGVPRMRISQIVRGTRAVTAQTAIKLSMVLGTSAQFWMNLQSAHDLAKEASKNEKLESCKS